MTASQLLNNRCFSCIFRMTQLWKVILFSCCGIHLFSVDAKTCSNFVFSRQLGRRLKCSIYKTFVVANVIECHTKCVSELSCFSVNFYTNENRTDVCELIKGTTSSLENPDCLVWKNEGEYNELLVSKQKQNTIQHQ